MKLNCIHGYFKLEEQRAGEFSDFVSLYGVEIERSGDHFTFADLVDAPDFSLPGGTFLGCPTTELFEGEPWEVMRANGIVYDFSIGEVVPIDSVSKVVNIKSAGNFYAASDMTGMIIPGSVMDDGSRVKDYAAYFIFDRMGFKYSEVASE